MQKQIYESKVATVSHDSDNDVTVVKWKNECGNILDDKHEKQMKAVRNALDEISPKNLLADLSACEYNIEPGAGSWYENPLFRMYTETSANKIALVVPKNLFVQAFFDAATAQEQIDVSTSLQYFDDPENALEWLNHE
jgi:hypothetical protein